MKRISIVLFTIILSINSYSQGTEPNTQGTDKMGFGVYGGINFQNLNGKNAAGVTLKNDMVTRFHLGIYERIPVATDFCVEVGLQYIGKGTHGNINYGIIPETRTIKMHYLEIPVSLVYRPLLGNGHFLLGFGPYAGYALKGSAQFSGGAYTGTSEIIFDKNINKENPSSLVYYKHLDMGANAFFGYEFSNHLQLIFNSQLGLIHINSNNTNDPNSLLAEMNTGFALRVGYQF